MKRDWFPVFLIGLTAAVIVREVIRAHREQEAEDRRMTAFIAAEPIDSAWIGRSEREIPVWTDSGRFILYGRDLIANTAHYFGPKGTVYAMSNGMNCQNCHLRAGTAPFGINFGKVFATYPQFRARNNGIQSIYDRVNDCFERSLNGRPLDSNTREMRAIYAYVKWLGEEIPRGLALPGTGIEKLSFLDRAADPDRGRAVFEAKCQSCHGGDGQGQPGPDAYGYQYPPLWGPHSYNDGAGLYRLSTFAGFVKDNMPFGADYRHPALSNPEAWDVAAFVNSRPRPHGDQSGDWPDPAKKPVDFPFGPYVDSFSEHQHKFGPFGSIRDFQHTHPIIANKQP